MPQIYADKEKYLAHTWIKIPKRWVDPKKEAEANLLLVAAGLKTYQQAAAESGGDFKEILDSIKEAVDYGDKIGIDVRRLAYEGRLTETDDSESPSETAGPGPNDQNAGKGAADGAAGTGPVGLSAPMDSPGLRSKIMPGAISV